MPFFLGNLTTKGRKSVNFWGVDMVILLLAFPS